MTMVSDWDEIHRGMLHEQGRQMELQRIENDRLSREYDERRERQENEAEYCRRLALTPEQRAAEDAETAARQERDAIEQERAKGISQDSLGREYHDYWHRPRYTLVIPLLFSLVSGFVATVVTGMFIGTVIEPTRAEDPAYIAVLVVVVAGVMAATVFLARERIGRDGKPGEPRFGTRYNRRSFNPDRPESATNVRGYPQIIRD